MKGATINRIEGATVDLADELHDAREVIGAERYLLALAHLAEAVAIIDPAEARVCDDCGRAMDTAVWEVHNDYWWAGTVGDYVQCPVCATLV